MNKKRTLRFRHDGTLFEATVTYNDEPFGNVRRNHPVGWNVTLHKPVTMNCGGDYRQITSISAAMMYTYSEKIRRQHFVYDDSPEYRPTEDEINIFSRAVRNILYHYYNAERIEHYADKIAAYEKALDRKYAERLEDLRQQRLALRRRVRSGEIDSKTYQKLYTPIRTVREELKHKIRDAKSDYRRRYFDGGLLKKRYRAFDPDTLSDREIAEMVHRTNDPSRSYRQNVMRESMR